MPEFNMKERVVVRMIGTLDKKQRKGFHQFLACGLFNTNPTLVQLYELILKRVLGRKNLHVSQAELLQGTDIKDSTTEKLLSHLLNLLNRFMAVWISQDDPKAIAADVFEAWHQNGLAPELLDREYRKMKRRFAQGPSTDHDLVHELRLEHNHARYLVSQPRGQQGDLFAPHHALLDTYYQTAKLKYLCASQNAGRIFRHKPGQEFPGVDSENMAALPALGRAYGQAYLLLQQDQPEPAEVERLLALLEQEGRHFIPEDRTDLLGFLLNSTFRGMGKGATTYEALADRTYGLMLEEGLLLDHGHIPGGHFKNVVSLKVRLGKMEEARAFIGQWSHQLDPREAEVLRSYTLGLVSFHAREYREAISKFRSVVQDAPEDMFWNLEARNMLWKSFFEAYDALTDPEQEEMLRLYHSFRQYVARNALLSDYHKRCYQNFIRLFNRLIHVGDKALWASTAPELEALQSLVEQQAELVHRSWLLQAIGQKLGRIQGF